jgi:hypothetical protein
MAFEKTVGSRAQVWHGTAKHTSGGLAKSQLMKNKAGRIVSRKKHHSAKRDNRLVKAGFKTKKGHFGFVKVGSRKMGSRKRRGLRGGKGMIYSPADLAIDSGAEGSNRVQIEAGMAGGAALSPASVNWNGIDGQGITNYDSMGSVGVQMAAGMAGGRRRRRRRMMGGDGTSGTPESDVLARALGA